MKKIPVGWLKEKGIKLAVGDVVIGSLCGGDEEYILDETGVKALNKPNQFDGYYLISFADRPNTGKQPVGGDVMVNIENEAIAYRADSPLIVWESLEFDTSWKPNFDALRELYEKETAMQKSADEIEKGNKVVIMDLHTPKPAFTKAMSDADMMPSVDTVCVMAPSRDAGHGRCGFIATPEHVGLIVKIEHVFTSRTGIELAAWTTDDGKLKGGVCSAIAFDAIQTDEEKAIDNLSASIFMNESSNIPSDILTAIKAGKIHGVKWVGE